MFGFNNLVPYSKNDRQSFLDNFFNEPFFPVFYGNEMKTDIKETEENYTVSIEIPGVSKKDIAIDYSANDVLSVAVSKAEEKVEKNEGFIRRERRTGLNKREYYLPSVSRKDIKAKYEDGVLTIDLPKNREKQTEHRIDIQ